VAMPTIGKPVRYTSTAREVNESRVDIRATDQSHMFWAHKQDPFGHRAKRCGDLRKLMKSRATPCAYAPPPLRAGEVDSVPRLAGRANCQRMATLLTEAVARIRT
jgi:hypothetical protein